MPRDTDHRQVAVVGAHRSQLVRVRRSPARVLENLQALGQPHAALVTRSITNSKTWHSFASGGGCRDAQRTLQLLDDHIDQHLAIEAAEHRLGRIEGAVLEVLVHGSAAAAQTVILTSRAALSQSARDVITHILEFVAVERGRERVGIQIAYCEITVVTTLETEQFRRVGSEVAFAIHAQYRAG